MASINKRFSNRLHTQVRRRGQTVSRSVTITSGAQGTPKNDGRNVDLDAKSRADADMRFGALIDLHIKDLGEVRKPIRRAKAFTLDKLQRDLGRLKLGALTRERLITYAKARAKQGAGPATISIDLGYIHTVLVHAAAVHGINVPTEDLAMARTALLRLGLIGTAQERDRRPTQDELDRIICLHHNNPRQTIPVGRIVKFAVATGMRQEEICSLLWQDIDFETSIAIVRNRKHPRRKVGNHQKVPLLDVTGYDAVAILREQRAIGLSSDRVFPYNGSSVGTAFRRAVWPSISRTCVSTTFVMKQRADCSRRASKSPRSRS